MTTYFKDKKLNKEQLRAVKYTQGPLLIIAGAGTGKTTVITERIKYLIKKGLAKPSEILALTFTNKAALEMEERVDRAMPYGYTQMWIMTFHSFCDRVLRAEALQIGLDPKYKLMTEAVATQLIRDSLFKFDLDYFRPLGNPTKFISGMLSHFSRLQDEDILPSDYLSWVKSKQKKLRASSGEEERLEVDKWWELARAYQTYEELKVKRGLMDFGDLVVKTLFLFRKRPNLLAKYQEQFKYLLVDEFQDTNYAQNELAILLAGRGAKANITVTGDDDQSVYRFRGAAVSNIIQFRKTYQKAKILVLSKNYRSTQEILDRAYDLVQHNNPDRLEVVESINKKLISQIKKKSEKVQLIHLNRVEDEAEEVIKEIGKLTSHGKKAAAVSDGFSPFDYRDVAILVRANSHAEPFIRALQRYNIPYQFLGPGRLFKQPEIIDLIAYLKVIYNFEDSVSLYRLLSISHFGISARDLVRIGNYARRYNLSLFDALEKLDQVHVSRKTVKKIDRLFKIINKHLNLAKKETAGQLLYYFLEETNLLPKLLNPDTPEAENRALNISKFFDKLKTYEVDHDEATVTAVVDWIELSMELGESPLAADTDWSGVNAVNILTVHSAKGLEFPAVFLVNLVSQRFPSIARREQIPIPESLIKEVLPKGDYHLQEERRLFYVGMTRAKEKLYFTASNYYGEGKREKKLSPFIFEALGDRLLESEISKLGIKGGKQLSFADYSPKSAFPDQKPAFSKLHIDYLSFSQIETFKVCPLHYKLKYIYKVPTPSTSSQSFGNSFHLTMKAWYEAVKKKEKPSKRLAYKLLMANWINEGYLSKSHELGSFNKAKRFLEYFIDNYFDPRSIPVAMEQPFLIKLDSVSVGGKIDRLDEAGDELQIIDYKTGAKAMTQKQADESLQLSIYALAATLIPEYPFARTPEKVKLSFMYFDTPSVVTTTRTKDQLKKAKEEIGEYKKEIESSDFKCSGNYLCKKCEYRLMCGV